MIDLTPLDVRNKRGDFKKILRGYDPQEVDVFLELVAERLEDLVRETLQLRERNASLTSQVDSQSGREKAVQEALVTAQELRSDIRSQAQREADLILQEAQAEGRRQRAEAEAEVRMMLRDAERKLEHGKDALEEMERRRTRFLKAFRQLLEREMDVVEVEEGRAPLEDRAIDLDLGARRHAAGAPPAPAPDAAPARDDVAEAAAEIREAVDGDGTSAFAPEVDDRPSLDAPIDELAAEYEGDGEDPEERDLFTLPEDSAASEDEDTRWG